MEKDYSKRMARKIAQFAHSCNAILHNLHKLRTISYVSTIVMYAYCYSPLLFIIIVHILIYILVKWIVIAISRCVSDDFQVNRRDLDL